MLLRVSSFNMTGGRGGWRCKTIKRKTINRNKNADEIAKVGENDKNNHSFPSTSFRRRKK